MHASELPPKSLFTTEDGRAYITTEDSGLISVSLHTNLRGKVTIESIGVSPREPGSVEVHQNLGEIVGFLAVKKQSRFWP